MLLQTKELGSLEALDLLLSNIWTQHNGHSRNRAKILMLVSYCTASTYSLYNNVKPHL